MSHRFLPVIFSALAICFASSAHSTAVTYSFSGEITRASMGDFLQPVSAPQYVGTVLKGSITFDPDRLSTNSYSGSNFFSSNIFYGEAWTCFNSCVVTEGDPIAKSEFSAADLSFAGGDGSSNSLGYSAARNQYDLVAIDQQTGQLIFGDTDYLAVSSSSTYGYDIGNNNSQATSAFSLNFYLRRVVDGNSTPFLDADRDLGAFQPVDWTSTASSGVSGFFQASYWDYITSKSYFFSGSLSTVKGELNQVNEPNPLVLISLGLILIALTQNARKYKRKLNRSLV